MERPFATRGSQLPCAFVCSRLPWCSVTAALTNSFNLLICWCESVQKKKTGKRGLEGNYWHFLLLSNWPSALPWGGPTAILHQLRRMERTRHHHPSLCHTFKADNLIEGLSSVCFEQVNIQTVTTGKC